MFLCRTSRLLQSGSSLGNVCVCVMLTLLEEDVVCRDGLAGRFMCTKPFESMEEVSLVGSSSRWTSSWCSLLSSAIVTSGPRESRVSVVFGDVHGKFQCSPVWPRAAGMFGEECGDESRRCGDGYGDRFVDGDGTVCSAKQQWDGRFWRFKLSAIWRGAVNLKRQPSFALLHCT